MNVTKFTFILLMMSDLAATLSDTFYVLATLWLVRNTVNRNRNSHRVGIHGALLQPVSWVDVKCHSHQIVFMNRGLPSPPPPNALHCGMEILFLRVGGRGK